MDLGTLMLRYFSPLDYPSKKYKRDWHSDMSTTMNIYTHVTEKQKDKAADKFATFMEI
jgi:hypothetical protein